MMQLRLASATTLVLAVTGCNAPVEDLRPIESCLEDNVEPRTTCQGFCEVAATECGLFPIPRDDCEEVCECQLVSADDEISPECAEAWETEYACASELDCDGFQRYLLRTGNDFPCYDESIATNNLCIDLN